MWFKNLRLYRLTAPFSKSAEELGAVLAEHAFQPCASLDTFKYGWVPPLGRHGSYFVHAAEGRLMVCARRQEKVLPAAVVNEALDEQVQRINAEEGRPVGRKERQGLKDEVIFSLLPRAFAKSSLDYAYIDPAADLIVVNAASARRAEDLLAALREALGSLKAVPLATREPPVQTMTTWLREGGAPAGFELGEECELQGGKDGRVIRCKNQDLTADEVRNHLEAGLLVTKLALTWRDGLSCVLDDQLAVKRLKFADELLDKAAGGEDAAETFDREFAVMTVELTAFIRALLQAFGGVEAD